MKPYCSLEDCKAAFALQTVSVEQVKMLILQPVRGDLFVVRLPTGEDFLVQTEAGVVDFTPELQSEQLAHPWTAIFVDGKPAALISNREKDRYVYCKQLPL